MKFRVGLDPVSEHLSSVFHALEVPLFLLSMGGKIQLANQAALDLLELDQQAVSDLDFAQLLREPSQAELISQQLMRNGHFRDFHAVLRPEGEPLQVSMTTRILYGPSGWNTLGVLVVITDLRPAAALQRNILQSSKMTVMGQMSAGIAHEVNNPLTGALGLTELILESPDLSAATRQDVSDIYTQLERCRTVIQRLLSLSRGPTGLEWEQLDLNELVASSLEIASNEMRLQRVECDYQPGSGGLVWTDRHHLQQVFLNLIFNACKASPGGGRLLVRTTYEADRVHVQFSDTGQGIPEALHQRIFEPFFTTADAGKGIGLGLSLCQLVVKSLGGQIRVQSQLGEGSTFTVTIPIIVPALSGMTWQHLEALQDRRIYARVELPVPFTLRALQPPLLEWELSSLDFSAGGVRTQLPERLDPEASYELILKLGKLSLPVTTRVAWQADGPQPQAAFCFENLSPAIRMILDEVVANQLHDGMSISRRRAARFPNLRYVELLDMDESRTLCSGYLTDVSAYGARFQSNVLLANGTTVILSLMPQDDRPACEVRGVTRWSKALCPEVADPVRALNCYLHGVSFDEVQKQFLGPEEAITTDPDLLEFLLDLHRHNSLLATMEVNDA